MSHPAELARIPTATNGHAHETFDRATLRRAFGTSLLAAWKTLGGLLAHRVDGEALDREAIDDALQKLEDLRSALCALRDAK